MSPNIWGSLYKRILDIYSYMLKKHGVLPSTVDCEDVKDFIEALQDADNLYVNIDEVGGW